MKVLNKEEYDLKPSAQKLKLLERKEYKERQRERLIREHHEEEFRAGIL